LSRDSERGSSTVELLIVSVIFSLLLTTLVSATLPILRAQSRNQAKVDTLQSSAVQFYRLQRDLRQSYYLSVYACSTSGTPSCSQPSDFSSTYSALVFPTAYANGNGQFQLSSGGSASGQPNWQGVTVYWIDGSATLHRSFDVPTGFTTGSVALSPSTAAQAVSDVMAASNPGALGVSAQWFALDLTASNTNLLAVEMSATGNEGGSSNETTYASQVLTRQ